MSTIAGVILLIAGCYMIWSWPGIMIALGLILIAATIEGEITKRLQWIAEEISRLPK